LKIDRKGTEVKAKMQQHCKNLMAQKLNATMLQEDN
jgi:hypothetical protein